MMQAKTGIISCIFLWVISFSTAYSNDPNASWNLNELNTAAHTHYLTAFEKEVVLEINKLRSDPVRYAREYILPLKSLYNGRKFYYPGDLALMTREGVSALNECIRFLEKQHPVPLVSPDNGLSLAANDHVIDQSKSGKTGHNGSDRSGFRDRIERYGDWSVRIAENIAYGNVSPQQVVIYLLIDDGVPSRGHRTNFLNKDFRLVGVAEGSHPGYERMCVMEFAGKFQNLTSNENK